MNKEHILDLLLTYAEPAVCLVAILVMVKKGQMVRFKFLSFYLINRLAGLAICIPLYRMTGHGISARTFYHIYFYVYWLGYAGGALFGLGIIYEIYKLAMAPLKGLQALGMLMFRWAAGIATAVAVGLAFGPHVTSQRFIMRVVIQLQQTQSILTVCLLMFVCLAIRPMGLSYRSRIFGVSVGVGMLAISDLVASAWLSSATRLGSTYNVVNACIFYLAVATWIGYFLVPEPKRRMIVLPTTSPFLRWNQISLALGDEPGFVRRGGVHPEIFAPAEIEIMRRASLKMNPASTYS